MELIRLPLKGTTNTRDIGGYVGANNKGFRWKKVLRSDCLSRLVEEDRDYLVNKYNLKKVIDLRSNGEIENAVSSLALDSRVKYINIPLVGDSDPNKPDYFEKVTENFLLDIYIDIIENKHSEIKQVIEEIISIEDNESVLFNCTAGKDRTGVVAMLLLGICGVSKQDIATNYIQTEANLKYSEPFVEFRKMMIDKVGAVFVENIVNSKVENIEAIYDILIEKYKSFYDYFLLIGISDDSIKKLVDSLTVDLD